MYQGLIWNIVFAVRYKIYSYFVRVCLLFCQKDATLHQMVFAVTMQVISPQRSAIQHIKSTIFLLFTFLH